MSDSHPDAHPDALQTNLSRLIAIGSALSSERNQDRLTEHILAEAQEFTNAEGGTLYLIGPDRKTLAFAILRNQVLKIALGGLSGNPIPFPALALVKEDGSKNIANVATACAITGETIVIEDAYVSDKYDFSGTRKFDSNIGYRSMSFLTVPLKNHKGDVTGVLQLINARNDQNVVIPFPPDMQPLIEALASLAAVALNTQALIAAQRNLFDSFIRVLAHSIDAKSPYTGGHCERVPVIAKLLAKAAIEHGKTVPNSPFIGYDLSEDEWFELHMAAWMHDCGKVVTPEFVMDKSTKLETIWDRMHEIRTRFEVIRRDIEIDGLRRQLAGGDPATIHADVQAQYKILDEDFLLVAKSNIGGEFMNDADITKIKQIGNRTWVRNFDRMAGLSWSECQRSPDPEPAPALERLLDDRPDHLVDVYNKGEVYNLTIQRGTLTAEERKVINDHIVVTQEMLTQLPFPAEYANVPDIAANHHEKMDGTGYPRGLMGHQMSLSERIMGVADVLEALTASDRPYKKAKTLSETVKILSFMKKDQHIDGDVFELLISSGVLTDYAKNYLGADQIDEVDLSKYLTKAA